MYLTLSGKFPEGSMFDSTFTFLSLMVPAYSKNLNDIYPHAEPTEESG